MNIILLSLSLSLDVVVWSWLSAGSIRRVLNSDKIWVGSIFINSVGSIIFIPLILFEYYFLLAASLITNIRSFSFGSITKHSGLILSMTSSCSVQDADLEDTIRFGA